MKKYVVFFILFFSTSAFSQTLDWLGQIGSSSNPNSRADINSIKISDSSVFISGYTSTIADLDPGSGTFLGDTNTFLDPARIGYVSCLDQSGNFNFSVRFNVIRDFGFAVDDSSNINVATVFGDWPYIQDSIDTALCIVEHTAGVDSIFYICNGQCGDFMALLKFDQAGNLVHHSVIGNNAPNTFFQVYSVKSTRDNGTLIYGSFNGTLDFDPGAGVKLKSGYGNPFLLKLDRNGNYVWFRKFEVGLNTLGLMDHLDDRIAIDYDNNIIIGGFFGDSLDSDPGLGVSYLVPRGQYNACMIKLDSNGNFIWSKNNGTLPRSGFATIADNHSINIDNQNNIIASGVFYGETDFDPSPDSAIRVSEGFEDVFIAKYSSNGDLLWVNTYGGTGYDKPYDIDIDNQGSVFATGVVYSDTIDFDPGIGVTPFYSNLNGDSYIVKYTSQGEFSWVHKVGSIDREIGTSLKTKNSELWIAGSFNSVVDFDFTGGPAQTLDPIAGRTYLVKYTDILNLLNEKDIATVLNVYPNPSSGKIKISNSDKVEIAVVSIYDMNGQIVFHQESNHTKSECIDLRVKPGLYFIKVVFDDDRAVTKKLIIH
jgi:hypothetical protein